MFDYQGVSGLSRMNGTIPTPDLKARIIGLNELDCHRDSIQRGRSALMRGLHQLMHLHFQLQPKPICRRVHTCGMAGKQDDQCRERTKSSRSGCQI